jgi:hypothetical protein
MTSFSPQSAMTATTPSESSMARTAFSLGIVAYAVAWIGALVFASRVFGIGGAIGLSLIFVLPFLVAVRMRFRWPAARGREYAFLFVLLCFVFGGSAFTVWRWYDSCMDIQHARDVTFEELARIVDANPAFHGIQFSVNNHNKCRYWIRGSVVSQADLKSLQALCDHNGFPNCVMEVAVVNGNQRKSK